MPDKQYGVITEVGDLGLGFQQLTEKDNKVLNESEKNKKTDYKVKQRKDSKDMWNNIK